MKARSIAALLALSLPLPALADAHAALAPLDLAAGLRATHAGTVGTAGLAYAYARPNGGLYGTLQPDNAGLEAGLVARWSLGGGLSALAGIGAATSFRAGASGGPRGLVSLAGTWGEVWRLRPSLSSSLAWISGPGSDSAWLAPVEAGLDLLWALGPVSPFVHVAAGADLLSATRNVARAEASLGLVVELPYVAGAAEPVTPYSVWGDSP